MNMRALNFVSALFLFAVLAAEASGFDGDGGSRWTFSAGPSWRNNVRTSVKTRSSGPVSAPYITVVDSGDYVNPVNDGSTSDWSGTPVVVDDPTTPGQKLYALKSVRTVEDHSSASVPGGGKDYEDSIGLSLGACCDVWANDLISVGIRGSFSGSWNMRSRFGGAMVLDTTKTTTTTTTYTFDTGPVPNFGGPPVSGVDEVYTDSAQVSSATTSSGSIRGGAGSVRWKGDLYMLGLGPRVSAHVADWLEVYGGCEMLVGISHSSVSSSHGSGSDTDAQLGCGAYLGLAGWHGNIGVFGQVGYDCLPESEVSAGGCRAETDYSGLAVTVGVALEF